ncbi:hypothetical protein UPYG_G00143780 [Umbra pygmaea]|uniref:PWWP domain-containing protein n=1 Tax=Umbra pygmaea TaxID=75934 RepID=A0ABD0XKT7_UMBPY
MYTKDMYVVPTWKKTQTNMADNFLYSLSNVTNDGFKFLEIDMPSIQKWWYLLIMERIEIQGHGQRFAFWTDEDRRLLQGQLDPVYRVPRRRGITEYRPLHMQAVTDRTAEEKRLVDFSPRELSSIWCDELQDTLMGYMKAVLKRTPTNLSFTDELQFILGVLFPEAIIYCHSMLRNLSLPDAEKSLSLVQFIIGVKWRNLIGDM